MTIFNTQVNRVYTQYLGWCYCCYKIGGKYAGNVAYCMSIWEVISFIVE